ncbi:MAG TPA: Coenzyme F420 hydrogenase/dehydrogenase, beta subunit C-terminal domain [Kiritimatiellia bacterium]|nr:Coenzyme F420 hydrogenase/dehydrogenase, beta subunit C-terminal domain [Kiritimatiellia bacterium]HRZ12343.1 Coenzyme F420 hydrogenase/dehydrogenase, beta subunit C-terminal domain [Kiritimatiellia bacterium]HSA17899.1 Coenzyme F420 hydrogenase/dehydrogenase, beta subunit C-terminal domain [Kiritimatiellia bacterium]
MNEKPASIRDVVGARLCTGCGICENVCPGGAISMTRRGGLYEAAVEPDRCTGCGLCRQVCPGPGVDRSRLGAALFPEDAEVPGLGRCAGCYVGHCADDATRRLGSSGGLVTGLLAWLLKTRRVDGAVTIRSVPGRPLEPEAAVIRDPGDLPAASGSRYCPTHFAGVLREIEPGPGRYVFVGLPCHLHALRKLQEARPRFRERIPWAFGLCCSGTRTFDATEYVLDRMGIAPASVVSLDYRRGDGLGAMRITCADGRTRTREYVEYYPALRSFFIPHRCALCPDHFAELADLAFGEMRVPEFPDHRAGTGAVVARGRRGRGLLEEAAAGGAIRLLPIDRARVLKAQASHLRRKKRDVPARRKLFRRLGVPVPRDDEPAARPCVRDTLAAWRATLILYTERAIGRRRALWWMIDRLHGGKRAS